MTPILRRVAFLLALLLASLVPVGQSLEAQDTLRPAAVVNDEVISLLDLAMRTRLALLSSGTPDTPEARQRIVPQVLRTLIDERLQMQEAERAGISVPDEQIDQAMANLARQNGMNEEQFARFLTNQGILPSALRDQLRASLTWRTLAVRRFRPQVTITPEEIDEVVERAANDTSLQYRVGEIVLAVDTAVEEDRVRREAEQLIQQLRNGASFSGLARQFSQSATAQLGGDLGWVQPGELPSRLADTVRQMQIGEIAGPIRTPIGFHILRLAERRQGSAGEGRVALSQILLTLPANAGEQEVRAVRERARVARAEIDGCEDVGPVAQRFGSPGSGPLGQVALADLPPQLRATVADLPIGTPSEVIEVSGGLAVLVVCEREGGGIDRDRIERSLVDQRINRLAQRELQELRRNANIDIRI